MKKKYIQLPKGYLSYSAKELWKHSPQRYKELYFNNNKNFVLNNSGLTYGKIVADALENEVETGDLLTDAAILMIPKYDIKDKEIQAEIKTKYGWVKVIGRPDSMDSETKNFYEYKTGKGKWTAAKAQKHPQMVFYAMLIYLAYGVILKDAALIWIQTEDVTKEYGEDDWLTGSHVVVQPTGHVETFNVTFTLQQILECIAETSKIAQEIELAWLSHVPTK